MWFVPREFVLLVTMLLLLFGTPCLSSFANTKNKIKSVVFLTPKFELGPGSVINRYYYVIDFPRGHIIYIALKSFNAEVVDDAGNSIPLRETYLQFSIIGLLQDISKVNMSHTESDHVLVRNSGLCQ